MTATAQKMIRVMLVDDQNLVREGIKSLLNLAGHIDIVGEAGDGEEALSLFAPLAPDVVLMDIRMPKLDGVSTLKQMKDTGIDIPVIIDRKSVV